MSSATDCPLAASLAARLRNDRRDLVKRWLDRIVDRIALHPNRVFPSEDLLDHVPLLIEGIADYLEDPVDEITTDLPVIAKAIELGELRHTQGFGAHEILREYEILGGVLFAYLVRTVDEVEEPCTRSELLSCAQRLFRAIAVIQQVTTDQYLRLAEAQVREREDRLRSFNRSVSHELKNRLGAAGGAAQMLEEDWITQDPKQVQRFASVVVRNVRAMEETLNNLLELSRLEGEGGRDRNVLLPDVAAEVKRQLRDFAEARGVRVEISAELPYVGVPAAALELALSNYLSNAIKYRNPEAPERWVRVEGALRRDATSCEVLVRVRDNGLGVPPAARNQLFQRFFRAHESSEEEGSGLGLSLVRDTIEGIGGRAWAEFPEEGSVFALAFPCPPDVIVGSGPTG